jgi:hypothetical protein
MEGFWTGLRNFLRPFRGVSKWFLNSYVSFYAAMHHAAGELAHVGKAWLAPVRAVLPEGFV